MTSAIEKTRRDSAPRAGTSTLAGSVVYLSAFDVADEIRVSKVRALCGRAPAPFEMRDEKGLPGDVALYRPLAVELPAPPLAGRRPASLLVRVYAIGVVTVTVRVAFEAAALAELASFRAPALESGAPLADFAREVCAAVCRELAPEALVRPSPPTEPESYTVFCLTALPGPDAGAWLGGRRREAAGLLCGADASGLSDEQVGEALRVARSFERSDLVVMDWDAALVVDLSGHVDDVLYVLELANIQLEEFRAMDQRLDAYLERTYGDLERRPLARIFSGPRTLRALRRFRVDVTKLADEVTHITKFVGDWYLARVYLGARERFHLDSWRASVDARLSHLDRLYGLARSETYELRMLWLEVVIVLMFAADLLLLFLK